MTRDVIGGIQISIDGDVMNLRRTRLQKLLDSAVLSLLSIVFLLFALPRVLTAIGGDHFHTLWPDMFGNPFVWIFLCTAAYWSVQAVRMVVSGGSATSIDRRTGKVRIGKALEAQLSDVVDVYACSDAGLDPPSHYYVVLRIKGESIHVPDDLADYRSLGNARIVADKVKSFIETR